MSVNLRSVSEKQELALLEEEYPDIKNLLSIYPPEATQILLDNKDKLVRVNKSLSTVSNFASNNAILMTCGPACPYVNVCVLIKNNIAPVGYACPIEKKLIMEMEADMVDYLEIDRNNPFEMELLWDLMDSKIIDMRISGALKDGKVTQTVESKIGPVVTTREELKPEVEIKLELKKLKGNIIDSFIGTRRAKKKYGMNSDASTLEQMILQAANNVSEKTE
jgi:hypothetical protein